MKNNIAIEVKNLTKKYTLRNAVKNESGICSNELLALNNISFQIEKGDCVGVIGNNGSGKSTLLKVLSGITKPTSGSVSIIGKVASVLDIGAGFHPELTGKENIYLNGQLHGFSKFEIRKKFDEIVAFSEISHFIDEPVKNYSNGMYLRLAFSILAHLDFDIYLLDEVLSVGDDGFREKCQSKTFELVQLKTKTFLIVSHVFQDFQNIATKYLSMQNGSLNKLENMDVFFDRKKISSDVTNNLNKFDGRRNDLFENIKFGFQNADCSGFEFDEKIVIHIEIFKIKKAFNMGISLKDQFKNAVFETYFNDDLLPSNSLFIRLELPHSFFNQGYYTIDFFVFENKNILKFFKGVLHFSIKPFFYNNTIKKRSWGPTKPNLELKFL